MSEELKKVLYGKTAKVTLADKREYTLREPDLITAENLDLTPENISKPANIKKLLYVMLKEDQPELTEKAVGHLVTFRMLMGKHPLMKTILEILGMGEGSKNEEAGTQ